jgi:hypothetical protein
MNQIKNPPLEHDFGLEFNYWLWTANTEITLTNVPWNNDYRDVVYFPTTTALNAYIDERDTENTKISGAMYAPADRPIQIDLPFNLANRFNYVRVYNPAQPISGDTPRYFYYFVTGVRYISPNNTEITVQMDIFQTYIRQVQFGKCYIERGHIGVANTEHFRNNGRDFLTVPEGIDTGGEYMNVAHRTVQIMQPTPDSGYDVLVVSTARLDADAGDRNNPRLVSADGSFFMSIASGANFWIFPGSRAFNAFMASKKDQPWVTQSIISITAVPRLSRYYPGLSRATTSIGAIATLPVSRPNVPVHTLWRDWRYASDIRNYIPERYRHFRKFYTFPYMAIELTSFSGTPIILKPEAWNSPHAQVREFAALIPPNQRIAFSPAGYNARNEANIVGDFDGSEYSWDGGEHLDFATQITNLPKLAVVNNGALGYLAANAHSIAYGASAADWSQQRALRGSEVAYDQAQAGISSARQLTDAGNQNMANQLGIQQQLARDNQLMNAIGGGAMSTGAGLAAGPVGAGIGALGGAGAGVLNAMTLGNSQRAAVEAMGGTVQNNWRVTDINNSSAQYMADTNKGLAQWAARGDYENAIAGINAKTQDAQLTQSSVSGQMGGEYLNLLSNNMGVTARWKMIDQAAISVIGEYWLRYGYAVRRSSFLPPNLMVMSKFTYWKLAETYIRAAPIPEAFKQVIRGIFEKGVTVWADPDDIGVTDWADNEIVPGIALESYNPPVPPIEPPIEPETPAKRKKKRMLVYKTTDAEGDIYALAGTSPGTAANWIETRNPTRALAFITACNNDDAVAISEIDFYAYKNAYIANIAVDIVGDVAVVGGPVAVTGIEGGPVITEASAP